MSHLIHHRFANLSPSLQAMLHQATRTDTSVSSSPCLPLSMSLLCLLISSAQATPFPGFSNAASGDLANNVTHCAVTADFNGDGLPDIFRGAENDRIFRNDGGGNFTDVTSNSGITGPTQDTSFAIAGDFDNDGDLDLFVGGGLFGFRPVQLYQNNGNFVFTDVTAAKGLTQDPLGEENPRNRSAAFVDFDKDGDLDLVLIIFGRQNLLFRNNGAPNFTFTDITSQAGFAEPGNNHESQDVTVGDFDTDGDLDIFVAGNFQTIGSTTNQLWRNNGNGTFTDVASTLGIDQTPQNAQSCCSGDIDNDGLLDLVVGAPGAIAIFRNSGSSFTDVASAAEVTVSGTVVSCQLSDLDFDGKLDLLLGLQSGGGSNELQILRNTTNGTISFTDVTSSLGTQTNNVQGLCVADFDNDNDLDIFAGSDAGSGNLLLLSNGQNLGNFIKLVLKATISNRSAIGTRIVSTFNPITIRDVISGGRSQNDLTPFIGLGSATSVTISVLWPNGITSSFENLAANQTIGALETQSVPIPSRVPVGKTRRLLLVGEGFADFNQFFINGIAVTDRKIINKTLGTDAVVGVSFTAPALTQAGIFDITARISGTNTTFIIAQEAIRYVGQKTVTTTISGGTEQSNYIMLGIPVSDDDSNALETSFFKQLGIGDTSKARAFSFDGTAYEEILTIGDNKEEDGTDEGDTEGKAIWVISSSTVNLALTGGDTSEGAVNGISNPPVAVILHTGFNQVSPGFVGSFNPNNAVVTNGETFVGVTSTNNTFTSKNFLEFTGNLASPYQIATSLDGQNGYWIKNLTNQSLVLFFGNPNGGNAGGIAQARSALRSFLRMDASQSSLPRSIKRSLTGNSQGIRRASDSSTTPPPPPGGITNAASSSGGGSGGGGCFIATAAYGSKLDPRLDPLRTFRDRSLLAAPVGNAFTKTYYANSPTAANALRTSKTARALVRKWLKPAVEGIGK